jgi:hypothetical protein
MADAQRQPAGEDRDRALHDPEQTTQLAMHPAMGQRLTNAVAKPHQAHFDWGSGPCKHR